MPCPANPGSTDLKPMYRREGAASRQKTLYIGAACGRTQYIAHPLQQPRVPPMYQVFTGETEAGDCRSHNYCSANGATKLPLFQFISAEAYEAAARPAVATGSRPREIGPPGTA